MDKAAMAKLAGKARDAADRDGNCRVIAKIDGVTNNGKTHAAGERFDMSHHIVPVHVQAGQVELVQQLPKVPAADKQQTTPRDKQVTGGPNK
ncbi:MAG TPA: hypothetical protein VNA25_09420 [Phycisphaerae bacterium]|nr:hypothetical protein [Phycisphaerae bacterium]